MRVLSVFWILLFVLLVGCSSQESDTVDASNADLPQVFTIDSQAEMELQSHIQTVVRELPASSYATNALLEQLNFTETETASWQRRKLTIGLPWIFNDQHAPFYIAQHQGFFEAAKLDVDLKEGGPARDSLKLLAGGSVDIAITSGGNAVIRLMASRTGIEVMAIGALNRLGSYIWLAIDSSIDADSPSQRVLTPQDFVGKTVGLQEGGEIYRDFFLKQFGFSSEQLKFTRAGATPDVLLAGTVDFYGAIYENQPRLLEGMGVRNWMAFRFSDYGWDDFHNTHVVLKKFLEKEPEVLRRYLWAMREATQFLLDHPEKAADITLNFGLTTSLTREQVLRRFELQRDSIEAVEGAPLMHMDMDKWNRVGGLLSMYGQIQL